MIGLEFSPEHKERILSEYQQSGLSVAKFLESKGFDYPSTETLSSWVSDKTAAETTDLEKEYRIFLWIIQGKTLYIDGYQQGKILYIRGNTRYYIVVISNS